jgi:hypothetical protein
LKDKVELNKIIEEETEETTGDQNKEYVNALSFSELLNGA